MSGLTRVGAFLVALAVVFAAALALGRYAGPDDPASTTHDGGHEGDAGHDEGGSGEHRWPPPRC